MTDSAKAVTIEAILLIVSTIVACVLLMHLESNGINNFIISCIPTTTIGLYILFGKYVFIKGIVLNRRRKTVFGLLFIFMMPIAYFIIWCAKKISMEAF